MSEKIVNVDLAPGEAFFRVSVDEDGATRFACGLYPSNNSIEKDFDDETDLNYDDMLTIFMSGISNLIQNDMDEIMRAGMQYIVEGYKPFDFVVSPEDVDYYQGLTPEQMDLLRMDVEGEA